MSKKSLSWMATGALACGLFLSAAGIAPAEVTRTQSGNLTMENVPEVPAALANRMQQYLSTRSATVCGWLPGQRGMLMYTRFGDTTQLHEIARPGAYRKQITFFSEPVHDAVINPNPQRHDAIILKDIGGSENYQLFHFDRDTGVSTLISDGQARFGSVVWSPDGSRIAYTSTKRNGSDWDIWTADPLHPESAKMVYQGTGHWSVLDWSEKNDSLLLHEYVSIVNSRLFSLDLKSGRLTRLGCAPDSKEVFAVNEAKFSAEGDRVFFTSNRNDKFNKLYVQNLRSQHIDSLSGKINWDVEGLAVSRDGSRLAFAVNAGGVSEVYLLDLLEGNKAYHQVRILPRGVVTGMEFDPNSEHLAVSINSSTSPGDIYSVDVDGENMRRWTFSEVGGLDPHKFVEPTLISYDTFDKVGSEPRRIPAFLYMPKDLPAGRRVPVVINIHGGPESQYQPYFSSLTQYLVNELGIAVLAPNVRGSSGYGSDYVQLDNGFLREDSVKDIGALLDWIKAQPNLNEDRVAVMGGSYGGFMTLASLCMYNDRLSAGVDNVGISNFVTFLKNTKDYRRDLRRAEYGDERDPKMNKFLSDIAPSNNAKKITKPLFVIQGANDPRVPLSEAEQIVREVRQNGGDVWYMVASDEGHGFRKKVNRDHYLQSVVMFLQKHLLDE